MTGFLILKSIQFKPKNVLGGIRTPDRWLRRPLLYPAELPGHNVF